MSSSGDDLLDQLVARCTFPPRGTSVVAACSGGPDSTALLALAVRAGVVVTAVHVHHGLRDSADDDAELVRRQAEHFDVGFRLEHADLQDGPNLEARARAERHRLLGPDAMTGHTADDQAETLLLALVRGAGAAGLAGMRTGHRHPILSLRRTETHALCTRLGLDTADDPTNDDLRFRRNRVRHRIIPLLDHVADRDITPLLNRTAGLLRDDDDLLDELARDIDPTDVAALRAAAAPLARRALRRWLTLDGYAPDARAIDRVLDVVRHEAIACELAGNRRVTRTAGRLHLTTSTEAAETGTDTRRC